MHKTKLLLIAAASLVASVSNAATTSQSALETYRSECGACHIAYPAVFLPAASWDAMLNKLDDHFGDNAELDPDTLQQIKGFLAQYNYDTSRIKQRYGQRLDTPGTPLRITKTRFFQAIHHEIPARMVSGNPKVKTFSQCNVCHRGAENGSFDEDGVHIPR